MTWIAKWQLRRLQDDLQEARSQVWELSSEVVDLRIDNENLCRKIEEYDAFLGALHSLAERGTE